jgi:hypothetical protein
VNGARGTKNTSLSPRGRYPANKIKRKNGSVQELVLLTVSTFARENPTQQIAAVRQVL